MRHSFLNNLLVSILSVLTCLCLAYSIFGAGLYICTTPEATKTIGSSFSNWDRAVFPEEDMAAIAESVREFSVEGTSSEELYSEIENIIQKNYPAVFEAFKTGSLSDEAQKSEYASLFGTSSLSTLSERYSLPQDALSHLSDCTPIFTTGKISIGVLCAVGIAGLVALGLMRGRKRIGSVLMLSATLVFLCIVGLIVWAVVDFDSLFTAMHSVLFAKGTWLFDSRSLLIQLFPEAFWIAMASLWALTSIGLSIVVLIAGKIIKH